MGEGGRRILSRDRRKRWCLVKMGQDQSQAPKDRENTAWAGGGAKKYFWMFADWRRKGWSSRNNLTVPPKLWGRKTNDLVSSITITEPYTEANARLARNLTVNKEHTRRQGLIAVESSC